MRVILASKSPRRQEILKMLGVDFEVFTADTDETCDIVSPGLLVEELARRKGREVCRKYDFKDALVISSDTVVVCNDKILGKPKDADDAARMLEMLSGKRHLVLSGVSLRVNEKILTGHEETEVYFSDISDGIINDYIATGEPMDKAGAYAIQGLASLWIDKIVGCYYNVVGFPTRLFCKMLGEIGIDIKSIIK